MIRQSGHHAAYVMDTHNKLPNGCTRQVAEFRADNNQEVEEQLNGWLRTNEPRHHNTPSHERRYRIIYVGR